MPRFFATCARGLEPFLAQELDSLGAQEVSAGRGGVDFVGDRGTLYRAALHVRTAVRILEPILEFEARSPDELYNRVRSLNWSQFTSPAQTLAVDCNVRDSNITHSQYAARRVKDAICDQFREATGLRPSVDVEKPMLGLNLHISRNHGILSRDVSWDSLHKRGYRPAQTRAPLNEALAAGLLMAAGWDGSRALCDVMCGGGTFLIEGAWIAARRPPGLTRKWFSFFGWPDFDRNLWTAIRDEARANVQKDLAIKIDGWDERRDAIEFAEGNARTASVSHQVKFHCADLRSARPPEGPPGLVIVNPPYGERLGEERELEPVYRALGETLKAHWPGWNLAVFTLHERLAKAVGLAIARSSPFFNGRLPCRLFEFENP